MRIGFVSSYPPIECGVGTYTEALNRALRKLDNETFVMSQFGAQGQGIFPVYQPDSPTLAADIFYTSTRMTPDVMHIQHEFALYGSQKSVAILELILRYRLAGIPVVTTLHTVYPEPARDERIILRNVLAESDAVIVHEPFQKETLVQYFGHGEKIHVIEHGIREIEPVPDAKRKLDLEGKKVVMICGYFRPSKGFHRVLNFFPEICRRDPDAVLVVAGKVRGIEAQDYQRQLFTQLNQSPVVDQIVFLRGQFPQHTFDTILSAADCIVLPYEKGSQSGMLAQCFALRRPAVVSALPAFQLLIQRSGGGIVCRTDEEFVEAILTVLNDPQRRCRLQENMARYVRERAGWSHIARKHVSVYHQVVQVPYGKGRYVYFPEPEGDLAPAGAGRAPAPDAGSIAREDLPIETKVSACPSRTSPSAATPEIPF
ncbi:MAG TPA: glycosyltransferase [Planctomycetaceae bacterium]|nr:glycosyltransferase [Planctomycetaceae bacterium]HIQ21604.1 glycosyltransferase [Planctomycetota bacterium]